MNHTRSICWTLDLGKPGSKIETSISAGSKRSIKPVALSGVARIMHQRCPDLMGSSLRCEKWINTARIACILWTLCHDGMRMHYLQIRLVLFPNPYENRSSPPTSTPTASLLARGSVHVTISNLYTSSIHSSKLIRNSFISNFVEQTSS